MSIHPSLKVSLKDQQQRSVLKRMERIKLMKEKGEWLDERSVFGLPKVKTVRLKMKIKKEKAVDATAEAGAAPAEAAAKPAAGAKPAAAGAKPAAKPAK